MEIESLNPFDRLGDILVSLGYIDRGKLEEFLTKNIRIVSKGELHVPIEELVFEDRRRFLANYHSHFIGEALVEAHLITPEQLKEALAVQENLKTHFPDIPKNKATLIPEILHKISRSRNVYGILSLIMDYCNKVLDAEVGTLYLYNKEKNALVFHITTKLEKYVFIEKEIPVDKGIAGWVFQNNKSVIVNDASSDERVCKDFDKERGFKTRNILCVPVNVNNKIEGALEAINKTGNRPFDEKDEYLLNILSNQVCVQRENRIHVEDQSYKEKQINQLLEDISLFYE